MPYCNECGKPNLQEAKFCSFCGSKLISQIDESENALEKELVGEINTEAASTASSSQHKASSSGTFPLSENELSDNSKGADYPKNNRLSNSEGDFSIDTLIEKFKVLSPDKKRLGLYSLVLILLLIAKMNFFISVLIILLTEISILTILKNFACRIGIISPDKTIKSVIDNTPILKNVYTRIKSVKPWIWYTSASAVLLIVVSYWFFSSNTYKELKFSWDKSRVVRLGSNREYTDLIEFIKKNDLEPSKKNSELAELAMDQILLNNIQQGKAFLENLFFEKKDETVIHRYAVNKKRFLNESKLISYYISGVVNYSLNHSMKDDIESVISLASSESKSSAFWPEVKYYLSNESYGKANTLLASIEKVNLGMNSTQSELKGFVSRIADNEYESQNCESDIESLKNDLKENNGFELSGYIVGIATSGYGNETYEIQASGNRYRSLLTRYSKRYTTKGYFSIRARKTGTRAVTVKEEYGGFEQEWNEYEEVTPDEVREMNSKKQELQNKTSRLNELINEYAQLAGQVKLLINNI
jgi:hypothetical protein